MSLSLYSPCGVVKAFKEHIHQSIEERFRSELAENKYLVINTGLVQFSKVLHGFNATIVLGKIFPIAVAIWLYASIVSLLRTPLNLNIRLSDSTRLSEARWPGAGLGVAMLRGRGIPLLENKIQSFTDSFF